MFAVTPYLAEREFIVPGTKPTRTSWQPCRVIGVDKDDEGEFAFIIEVVSDGCTFLEREPYVRKMEPGNPL